MAKSNYGFFSENKTFSNSPAAPCVVINCFLAWNIYLELLFTFANFAKLHFTSKNSPDCNSFSVFFLSTGSTNVIPYSIDKSHCKSVFVKISSFFYPEPYSTLLIL